jgi:gas vesicle protein
VNDRTRVALATGLGALAGAVTGYLFLTDRGRELRTDLEPKLDELIGEAQRLGLAFDRTRRALEDGWKSFNQLVQEDRGGEAWKTTHH